MSRLHWGWTRWRGARCRWRGALWRWRRAGWGHRYRRKHSRVGRVDHGCRPDSDGDEGGWSAGISKRFGVGSVDRYVGRHCIWHKHNVSVIKIVWCLHCSYEKGLSKMENTIGLIMITHNIFQEISLRTFQDIQSIPTICKNVIDVEQDGVCCITRSYNP